MANKIEIAKKYLAQGLSVIPVGANKIPIGEWKDFQAERMTDKQAEKKFSDDREIGIVCGEVSGNLEAIDVDCKYDLSGTLFSDFIDLIGLDLTERLVIQKTPSNGFHLLYRCEKIEGNKKLAEREATDEEKAEGERVKVLIETRGRGGYIVASPCKGYEVIQHHFHQIPVITPDERERIFNAARSLNQVFKEHQIHKPVNVTKSQSNVFEDYDNRADIIGLLISHGWTQMSDNGDTVKFRRPGKTDTSTSGDYQRSKKWFKSWSTSTPFEAGKAYKPYAVFTILECGGDFSQASKRLKELGYGNDSQLSREVKIKEQVSDYLSVDDMQYLRDARDGKIKMGLSTGIPTLDAHFRFKEGNFVVVNGHDNVGKSSCMWYLAILSAINHGWKWIVYSGENKSGYVKRKMLEFKYCKVISEFTDSELSEGNNWINEYFTVIANNDIYTYKHILAIAKKLFETKKYNAMLIDPYNSLFIEMDEFTKLSTHDYHYLATSEFRLFCHTYNCSVFLNCHAVTEALRRVYSKDSTLSGYPMPPQKADTEGGGKFSNRADDFITIHRLVQHPDDWMWTEFHVRKIKEIETGGKPTPFGEPVRLRMINKGIGFEDINGFNAIRQTTANLNNKSEKNTNYLPYYEAEEKAPF